MNNPLRYRRAHVLPEELSANNDQTTILQVVRNPSWRVPYIACGMMALGLVLQFGLHLAGFFGRRRRAPAGSAEPLPALSAGCLILAVLPAASAFLVWTSVPPRNPGAFDILGFGRLPVLADGRIKPLNTARPQLAAAAAGAASGWSAPTAAELTPDEWLLDVFFRPDQADTYRDLRRRQSRAPRA